MFFNRNKNGKVFEYGDINGGSMTSQPLGPTGVLVAQIGQGTWNMEKDHRHEAIIALQRGFDLGMTHIDTAEMYGAGRVEEIVGEAIRGRRHGVFLTSKVLPRNASYAGTLRACEASLRRLETDYLDLYLLHWLDENPLEETIRAFELLKSEGKIRAYGVSNFDGQEIEQAVALAGQGNIVCNQVLYHLQERSIEHTLIPTCEKHGIAVVGYSPFGSGRFPSRLSRAGRALAKIAASHKVSPYQIALAFLTRRPNLFTIPKAGKVPHVEENAGTGRMKLSEKDVLDLDQAFPLGRPKDSLPTL